jgi:hypothetical protein
VDDRTGRQVRVHRGARAALNPFGLLREVFTNAPKHVLLIGAEEKGGPSVPTDVDEP